MNIVFLHKGAEFKLKIRERRENTMQVSLNGDTYDVSIEYINPDEFLMKINGKIYDTIVTSDMNNYSVRLNSKDILISKKSALQLLGGTNSRVKKKEVKTSMPGRIVKVLVSEGDQVEEGQAVLILEAMKMQNEIKSPQPGKVVCIRPKTGESVETNSLLFIVE
jgi:biotin carboxyl carrier protein